MLLRSFTIQGSWNYRSMIGGGFAFALLPALRHVHGDDPEAVRRAVERHAEHFNAHPYLAALAVAAVARMEAEGAAPEAIRRFKKALRGPLGSLGDRLMWVTWLPISLLSGLAAVLLGLGPLAVVLTAVGLYNGGHLALRYWGFRIGLREGSRVGARLHRSRLSVLADRLAGPAASLVGIVAGLALVQGTALEGVDPWLWAPVAAIVFFLGIRAGQSAWSWAASGVAGAVTLILVIGVLA